jgi:hypothetical protein
MKKAISTEPTTPASPFEVYKYFVLKCREQIRRDNKDILPSEILRIAAKVWNYELTQD